MNFTSFNFKLVVIDALIENGVLASHLQALEAEHADEEWDDYYGPNPAIVQKLNALALQAEQLATVTSLTFDAGNEIYQILAPNWDGEDYQFEVYTLTDVALLPNLEKLIDISMLTCSDLRPLLACPKLQELYLSSSSASDQATQEVLRARGVKIPIQG